MYFPSAINIEHRHQESDKAVVQSVPFGTNHNSRNSLLCSIPCRTIKNFLHKPVKWTRSTKILFFTVVKIAFFDTSLVFVNNDGDMMIGWNIFSWREIYNTIHFTSQKIISKDNRIKSDFSKLAHFKLTLKFFNLLNSES
ncbi:hypothetical protein KOXY103107_16350 [Komagataeibacter xylinus]